MRIAGRPAQYSLLGAVRLNSIVSLSSWIARLRASVWITTLDGTAVVKPRSLAAVKPSTSMRTWSRRARASTMCR